MNAVQEQIERDIDNAELEAQERHERELQKKIRRVELRKKLRKCMSVGFKSLLILALLALAVFALGQYIEGDRKGGFTQKSVTDFRECRIPIPGSEDYITGTRSYSYKYSQFGDWRWLDTTTIEEETRINIEGNGMTIIGTSAGKSSRESWTKNIDIGERYSQPLQREERYTFVIGSKRQIVVIDYNEMCR